MITELYLLKLWIYSFLKLVLNSFIFLHKKNSKFCGLSPVPGQNFISLHTVRGVESHPGIGFPPPFLTNFYRKRGRGTQWVKKRVHQGTKNCHFLAKFVSVNTFVIFFSELSSVWMQSWHFPFNNCSFSFNFMSSTLVHKLLTLWMYLY